MKFSSFLCLVSCFLFFIGCKKSTTPITTTQISLTAEYVGVTEAELRLQVDSSQPYDAFQLLRNGQPILSVPLSTNDTTMLDSTLFPAHTYTYQTALFYNARQSSKSNEVTLTTMDTTSHDFQWEIFTIESPFGSGALYDVAVVNNDDIWCVGEIYSDSAQPGMPYNAVHWNGQKWELKRIPYTYNGQSFYHPMNFTFSFDNGDVWFGGNGIVKWDGNRYSNVEINPNAWGSAVINKAWGNSTENVYIIGNNRSIAHYNSNVWEKIESGTELPIKDIWGVSSTVSEQNLILAPASKKYNVGEKKLLHINNNSHEVKEMLWPFQNRRIHSVWFRDPRQIWVCGAGIFLYKNSEWNEFTEVPLMFTNRIRGQDINDIFVVGDFGIVAHFNGISWKIFFDFPASLYYSCDYKENIMVAVGGLNPDAIILQATRR